MVAVKCNEDQPSVYVKGIYLSLPSTPGLSPTHLNFTELYFTLAISLNYQLSRALRANQFFWLRL